MIGRRERVALEALRFNPAATPDDVWRASPYDVPELHERVVREILSGVGKARRDDTTQPLGVAMQGRAGSGKTHLLGAVRDRIQREGGYFFLVNMLNGRTFWESTALAMVEGMGRDAIGWGTQLRTFLRRLTSQLGIAADVRDAVAGTAPLSREHLDTFVRALRTYDGEVGRECQDTARALVLHGSQEFADQDVGYAHLISEPGDPAARAAWGLTPAVRTPQQIVRDISRLMALTLSPTVIAVDQIDTLFAQTSTALFDRAEGLDDAQARSIAPVADGLLTLRDITRRTLTVVSCLPDVWELLTRSAPTPVAQRFRMAVLPDRIPTPEIGREIIARRFAAAFAEEQFVPPWPTWPVAPEAFGDAPTLTPRALLLRVDRHVSGCLDRDEVVELTRLIEGAATAPVPTPFPVPAVPAGTVDGAGTTGPDPAGGGTGTGDGGTAGPGGGGEDRAGATGGPTGGATTADPTGPAGGGLDLTPLDRRFAELVATARVGGALDPATEDEQLPVLLAAGLAAWIGEQAPTGATYKYDPLPGRKPALHGRLIEVLDEATENEAHWCFRGITSLNATAVLSRVRAACTMAGLDRDVPQRRLVLLRNSPWPTGKRTREVLDAFHAAGGLVHPISERELKIFAALLAMSANPDARFGEWLVSRRPAGNTPLFRAVLGTTPPAPVRTPGAGSPAPAPPTPAPSGSVVRLGHSVRDRRPFEVGLESLRRHSVVFAGSGSGKTVLIRRLVEECARQGVSSIVLDPNNDLARLGDAWPEPPAGWEPGDDGRARDYLEHTDVVVWTPRVTAGRPLSFQPLPDFTPVRDSPDELDQAIHSAVAALAPRAGVDRSTKHAQQGRAVLTEALRAYAKSGLVGLHGFTEFLAALPDGVSRMARADRLALDLAETLKAAMVTDPLFGGAGTAADPGVLLTPAPGKRARVSVISFVGLTSDEQRQSFVNQLQMALFAWIRRHPAGDRPLGGLFVMDEAQTLAPSTGNTPCTASSIALASQARKYGLGLVFATQAPKGLHNQIAGNATTQFFGLLNAPAQIDAARALAAAKGGQLPDIGLMDTGEFYAAGEGFSFEKVRTPLCLTHHPRAPLTPEEVVARAAR